MQRVHRHRAAKAAFASLLGLSACAQTRARTTYADSWQPTAGMFDHPEHPRLQSLLAGDRRAERNKTAVVIGSGVVGVTSAYELSKKGYNVVVVDAASGPGKECSTAAAGGMQKGNPQVDRATWRAAMKSILFTRAEEQFFVIRWFTTLTDPHFWRWVWHFYLTSRDDSDEKAERQQNMLDFTVWAIDEMISLMRSESDGRLDHKSDLRLTGALKLHATEKAVEAAKTQTRWSATGDVEPSVYLTKDQTIEIEPWLKDSKVDFLGASRQTQSASGNCIWLTEGLSEKCKAMGVTFVHDTKVLGFECDEYVALSGDKAVTAIQTSHGRLSVSADTVVVVAAGSWSTPLLREMNVYCPIYPLKGYNVVVTLDPAHPALKQRDDGSLRDLPNRIIVSADGHSYVTRFHNQLRFASIGEFAGWDTQPDSFIEKNMRRRACNMMPNLSEEIMSAPVHCGLRPFVSDGILLIGRVPPFKNVFINAGPGFNGWKCAIGAGRVLAGVVDGESYDTQKTKLGFDPSIFDPSNRTSYSPVFCKFVKVLSS